MVSHLVDPAFASDADGRAEHARSPLVRGGEMLERFGLPASVVALTALIVLRLPLDLPVEDFFHEGEYFGSLASMEQGARYGYPYVPHGLLDVLPFRIGKELCGAASFGCTRLVNVATTAVAMLAYAWCAALVIGTRRDLAGLAMVAVAGLFILINGQAPNLIALHQGAPSVRDVLLFVELVLLFRAGAAHRARTLHYLATGVIAGIGLFWCYNRGLIGLAAVGVYAGAAMLRRETRRDALLLVGGCVVGTALIYASDPGAFASHFRNILFWSQMVAFPGPTPSPHPSAAAEAFDVSGTFSARTMVSALVLLALTGLALSVSRLFRASDRTPWDVQTIALAVVALLFVKVTLARPDIAHAIFSLPVVLLLVLRVLGLVRPGLVPSPRPAALFPAAAIVLLIVAGSTSPHRLRTALVGNARLIGSGMPANRSLVSADDWRVALLLRKAGGCTLTVDNEGIYHGLSDLPACSPFMYPFYAPRAAEPALIADLSRNRPALLVGRSSRKQIVAPLSVAKPRANAWVIAHYPTEIHVGRVLLRARRADDRAGQDAAVPRATPAAPTSDHVR